ncbi:Uncharacterized protein dnm_064060 [Desulfonema magnum]|uniref:Uncharacterized protein n=1 Tax=Desulfonema magnum TaxID=45655 RepID=A0A975GQX0_9BACT|nr:Uncharacterized protein dnm_064060 [Desulfonema magnum]
MSHYFFVANESQQVKIILPDGVCNPLFCRTGFATPSGIFSRSLPVNVSDGVANPVRHS